jgi:hypothetical protein
VIAFTRAFQKKAFSASALPAWFASMAHRRFWKDLAITGKGCCTRSSATFLFNNLVALISETVSKLLTMSHKSRGDKTCLSQGRALLARAL